MDCRYCHNGVEKSWFSNIPGASTCMNCHSQVLKDDPRLAIIRESATNNTPIPWVQVHRVPDYVYFNHEVHVTRGISCVECHGRIDQMDEVRHAKPLSMSFCLDCHRDPAAHIRPDGQGHGLGLAVEHERDVAANCRAVNGVESKFVHDWRVESLESCSACHR
jgi:NAD-dependent SIR2 family protein deacetylase